MSFRDGVNYLHEFLNVTWQCENKGEDQCDSGALNAANNDIYIKKYANYHVL